MTIGEIARLLTVTFTLVACTPDPIATSALDLDAKRFQPEPGQSALYVVRTKDIYELNGISVHLGERLLGWLATNTYIRVDLPPGQHRIMCGESDNAIIVTTSVASVTFIEALPQMGWWSGRCNLFALDEVNGRDRVGRARRLAIR